MRSLEVPKSVHQLRPGDIDVIGAMGDSLTAGFGIFATNLAQVIIENRGVTALGGGQGTWREFLTLPNILKEFNPSLFGYAVTDAFTFEKGSEFNVAESGAISNDMPYMAQAIINRMKSDSRVNIKKHWKVSFGRSLEVPKSVHQLRPGDIDVIGAMGDSLTAGFGIFATNLAQVIIENRGVTALGGGQASNALWNNLMQPVEHKSRNWKASFEEFVCPTEENPYIKTLKNSRSR
ncbi:phospholipase B1, membrane-associated-like [Copidosoma floridanum]|uniref:phospholipase B1, membrane-associated-like n=1 Tax=Copidosoma floridanum TaxID=29053 RepID=UPI0006C95A3D|nr:phospholipase B1, membrane-associated-like [Copidosoma floridanum]